MQPSVDATQVNKNPAAEARRKEYEVEVKTYMQPRYQHPAPPEPPSAADYWVVSNVACSNAQMAFESAVRGMLERAGDEMDTTVEQMFTSAFDPLYSGARVAAPPPPAAVPQPVAVEAPPLVAPPEPPRNSKHH
jgi:hypothetical protein